MGQCGAFLQFLVDMVHFGRGGGAFTLDPLPPSPLHSSNTLGGRASGGQMPSATAKCDSEPNLLKYQLRDPLQVCATQQSKAGRCLVLCRV